PKTIAAYRTALADLDQRALDEHDSHARLTDITRQREHRTSHGTTTSTPPANAAGIWANG
ncbi:hypothetical protein, partial [Actinophytocola sp.]|uniref:hypothetical protein n=1 Tax=Actinophytocola sp. TaxID=1872138 RepID=UPI003D6AE824